MYDAVDRPAQKLTLLMGPKKPIDYENLHASRMESAPQRKSRKSSNAINIKPVEVVEGLSKQSSYRN